MDRRAKRRFSHTSVLGHFFKSALRALPASVVVSLVTFICFGLHVKFPTVSLLYLIIVVLQSLVGDLCPRLSYRSYLSSALITSLCPLSSHSE